MPPILDFFKSLALDANVQARLLLTILHLPAVLLLVFLFRQEAYLRKRQAYQRNLLFILKDFRAFCNGQQRAALRGLETLTLRKRSDLETDLGAIGSPARLDSQWLLLLQNPEVFITWKIALKAGVRFAVLRDQVRLEQGRILVGITHFLKEYRANERQYYQHISKLAGLHDQLQEYTDGRSMGRSDDREWVRGYLTIFEDWYRAGAAREPATLQTEIVEKTDSLNKAHSGSSLVVVAAERVTHCQLAFTHMRELEAEVKEQLSRFIWQHRMACRMTTVLINRMDPTGKNTRGYIARAAGSGQDHSYWSRIQDLSFGKRRYDFIRPLLYAVVSLLVLLSIAGIFYRGVRPPSGSNSPAEPVQKEKPAKRETIAPLAQPVVFARPSPMVYGIDISRYQGNLLEDIDSMDTLHFVICKATEGEKYTDPDFQANWSFIRKRGLVRGAYHFYQTHDNPLTQAQHFLATVNGLDSIDMPPVIDVEDGSIARLRDTVGLQVNLLLLLKYIRQAIGRKPIIYTDLYFANRYLVNDSFSDYPLWLAEYSGRQTPELPKTWKKRGYAIWQKQDSYRIDSRFTDFDIFNGNGNKLVQFIRQR